MAKNVGLFELSLRDALEGLEERYIEKEGATTRFTAAVGAFVPSEAKAAYVEKKLDEWVAQLNERPGVRVLSAKLKRPSATGFPDSLGNFSTVRLSFGGGRMAGKMVLEIEVSGAIDTDGLHPDMAKAISGAAKKRLYRQLCWMLPHDFEAWDPKVAAGSLDYFHIDGRAISHSEEKGLELDVIAEIGTLICEAGVLVTKITCFEVFAHYYMNIMWQRDVSDSEREQLITNTKALFQEKLGYTPKVCLLVH